jgi:glycosyltransferase involved in cell wall biosynthesis
MNLQKKDPSLMIRISVIIPVFNMIDSIEQTLCSIWNQNYKNLQLIVVDGGSTDGTKDFLELHISKIDILISEKDKGQYHAIQKGMNLATGEVVSWLNADDVYFPWTLRSVSRVFKEYEDVNWIAGLPAFLNSEGNLTHIYNTLSARPKKLIQNGGFRKKIFGYLQQESMFYRKELWNSSDGLNLNYKLAGDFELWTRFAEQTSLVSVNIPLAGFRISENSRSKKMADKYELEVKNIIKKEPLLYKLILFISKNNVINKLIRLMVWRKADVIYFSVSKQNFLKAKKFRPISSISLTQLILEK